MSRVPVWTGLDPAPGAWEVWRIAIVGIAGERGLYDLLVPGGEAQVMVEKEANRSLWFLLARATGSPAVGVVREFEGRLGSPDGRGAWTKLQEVYGGMTAEEKPQQLLKAEIRVAETVCDGPGKAANFLVGLGELWALFESLGEPKTDNAKKAALIRGIRESLPGTFQQLVAQPQLDYAGLSRVLVSATSYMQEEAVKGEPTLGLRATTTCAHCGKAGHSIHECWTAHPEMKPAGRNRVKCFGCNKTGHLKRDCPEKSVRKSVLNNNTESFTDYSKPLWRKRKHQNPIVDSGCTLHLTSDKGRLTSPTTATHSPLIRQADGTTLRATHKGHMALTHQTGEPLTLEDALFVPGLSEDLISVKSLNERGYSVNFTPNGGAITKGGQQWNLVRGGGAWVFPEARGTTALTARAVPTGQRNHPPKINWQVMHEKLGHASERKLRALEKAGLAKLTGKCEIDKCEPCLLCKPRRTSIPSSVTHSGEVVVQVDGMPWRDGHRGQSGAITSSVIPLSLLRHRQLVTLCNFQFPIKVDY